MITGLAHPCFHVKSLETSLAFYRDKLGLHEAFDFVNEEGKRFGIYLHVGGRTFIELFEGKPEAAAPNQSFKHICLEVDDLEATMKTFQERGVEVTGFKRGKDQSWQAWITDPDGNRIELHHYTPQSKQTPWLR